MQSSWFLNCCCHFFVWIFSYNCMLFMSLRPFCVDSRFFISRSSRARCFIWFPSNAHTEKKTRDAEEKRNRALYIPAYCRQSHQLWIRSTTPSLSASYEQRFALLCFDLFFFSVVVRHIELIFCWPQNGNKSLFALFLKSFFSLNSKNRRLHVLHRGSQSAIYAN